MINYEDNKSKRSSYESENSDRDNNENLNNFVTKIDIFANNVPKSAKSMNDPIYFEQGQNIGDQDDSEPSLKHVSKFEISEEKLMDRYIDKDSPSKSISVSKSEQSQLQSSHMQDSPPIAIEEEESQSELHKAHLIQTLQAIQYIKTLPNNHSLDGLYVNLPPHAYFSGPETTKTIIFDLDETLVHCVDDPENDNPHVILKVVFPSGEVVDAGINIRPYAIECLKEANKYFQVVVFTASHQSYADVVLDYLDPNHDLIQYRLYRDSCIQSPEGVYIKDLRIIKNRLLENLVIVDNAVYSFGYQLDNGVPIIPFYDDPNDEELHHLVFYMK